MIELIKAIQVLAEHGVDFVIVGGMAIRSHGSGYLTQDLDICYSRDRDNLKRLAMALAPLNPRPRNFPMDLPFIWDESTIRNGTNFTLQTSICDIDLLGEVAGIGAYAEVSAQSVHISVGETDVKVLSIEGPIKAKTTAGRLKDAAGLQELEALKQALSDED